MLHLWGLYLGPHFCGAQGAPRGTRGEGREGAGVAGRGGARGCAGGLLVAGAEFAGLPVGHRFAAASGRRSATGTVFVRMYSYVVVH